METHSVPNTLIPVADINKRTLNRNRKTKLNKKPKNNQIEAPNVSGKLKQKIQFSKLIILPLEPQRMNVDSMPSVNNSLDNPSVIIQSGSHNIDSHNSEGTTPNINIHKLNGNTLILCIKQLLESLSSEEAPEDTYTFFIKPWNDLMLNLEEGRCYLSKFWKDLNLNRTALFIEDKNSCSITTMKKLYDRMSYLYDTQTIFPDSKESNNVQNNIEVKYEEDKILFEETMQTISKDTHYLLFIGNSYKNLDEFGSQLFTTINFELLSEEFPIRALGGDRFVVGFNKNPPMENLIRKMVGYKIMHISFERLNELLDTSKEKTSGIIFFLNNKAASYVDIQISIAKLNPEIKNEIKRVLTRKDMFIIFVQIEKLSYMLNQLRYLTVNDQIFKSSCNLTAEYHNNIGKLILENCPLYSPAMVKTFMVKRLKIEEQYIENIYQFRRPNNNKNGKNMSAFLVWIRNPKNIRRALLSVIDYATDKKLVGFFKWPNSKISSHNCLTNDLV